MVTILKNTTKLVTEVPFPALTLCSSGLHMNNVEKKLIEDFENWRVEKNRSETKKEAIYRDTEEFMLTRFQIKPRKGKNSAREQPISILDILDTMIAPNVDAAVAANSVRENVIACKQSTTDFPLGEINEASRYLIRNHCPVAPHCLVKYIIVTK